MTGIRHRIGELVRGLRPASDGAGPLLERDYWAVIEQSRLRPHEIADLVARRFEEFAPSELVEFTRDEGQRGVLDVGDELAVKIRPMFQTRVRVLHRDRNSLTLGTFADHPEAGRITFGAYPNERADVIFHIRSRARSRSNLLYAGFLTTGQPMQTNTWTEFVNRVAATAGEGVVGYVYAEKREVGEQVADRLMNGPTFIAKGN